MKPSYQELSDFMQSYFDAYNSYGQSEETMHHMDNYYADDFASVAYMHLEGHDYPLRLEPKKVWLDFLVKGHLRIVEEFIPLEYSVDPEQLTCTARLQIKKYAKVGGMLITDMDAIAYYKMRITENGKPILRSLYFYCGDPSTFASLY